MVLGNPPWEKVTLQQKEWFAARRPEITAAPNAAARKRMIKQLLAEDPALHGAFVNDLRKADGEGHLIRDSGLYPLCGRGDVNTYSVFAEMNRAMLSDRGRVGCIVPSGIASDATTKLFFQDLIETQSLIRLYDFENRRNIFPGVGHGRSKFSLLTLASPTNAFGYTAKFLFFAYGTEDLREEARHFTLSSEDVALLNPNTRTCPIFRSKRDAEINKSVYRRVPVLVNENKPDSNPWKISFLGMFHMANDSNLFHTAQTLEIDGCILEGNHLLS